MAKATEKTENTETAQTEVKEKAKAGTSLAARAKQLVLNLAQSFKEHAENLAAAGITFVELGELEEVAKGFAGSTSKGLPLKVQLENCVAEMNTILRAAPVVDGLIQFSPEQETAYENLVVKKKRLVAAIAKENEPKEESPENPT